MSCFSFPWYRSVILFQELYFIESLPKSPTTTSRPSIRWICTNLFLKIQLSWPLDHPALLMNSNSKRVSIIHLMVDQFYFNNLFCIHLIMLDKFQYNLDEKTQVKYLFSFTNQSTKILVRNKKKLKIMWKRWQTDCLKHLTRLQCSQ